MKVRVALIGFGFLGKFHAEKVEKTELAELVAIVEMSPDRIAAAKAQFPKAKVVKSLAEVINEIDAGVVVTPTKFHYQVVEELLLKNKHVFCEKPLCPTLEEASKIKSHFLNAKNCVFQVGHSERFHDIWNKLQNTNELFKDFNFEKFIATPSVVRIQRTSSFKGRATDVDVVNDLMIHDLDLINYLFHKTPMKSKIKTHGFKSISNNWDYVWAQLDYKNLMAEIIVSRYHAEEVRKIEIVNELGCLVVDLLNCKCHLTTKNVHEIQTITYEKRDHLLIEHTAFYKSIQNKTQGIVTLDEGILMVEQINLILRSLSEK
ncbi:MAG: Gfo/Idh/MocA family oxidoreductase [Bacteriovoracaceae bacterium]